MWCAARSRWQSSRSWGEQGRAWGLCPRHRGRGRGRGSAAAAAAPQGMPPPRPAPRRRSCPPLWRSADEVVASADGEGLPERVRELTGGAGAYAAIECVGGDLFGKVASAVRPGGTAIIYGAMSGLTASFRCGGGHPGPGTSASARGWQAGRHVSFAACLLARTTILPAPCLPPVQHPRPAVPRREDPGLLGGPLHGQVGGPSDPSAA